MARKREVLPPPLCGVLFSNDTTNDNSRFQDSGRTEASNSHRVANSHSVLLITVSMNGIDVLKLLSRMATDTSSIATWLEQPNIILILSRDKLI